MKSAMVKASGDGVRVNWYDGGRWAEVSNVNRVKPNAANDTYLYGWKMSARERWVGSEEDLDDSEHRWAFFLEGLFDLMAGNTEEGGTDLNIAPMEPAEGEGWGCQQSQPQPSLCPILCVRVRLNQEVVEGLLVADWIDEQSGMESRYLSGKPWDKNMLTSGGQNLLFTPFVRKIILFFL